MSDAPVPPGLRAGGQARLSIAVIGLGSIGGVAAACLRAADRRDIVACVRQPLERLTLERPEGTVEVGLCSMTDPASATPVDWVLLCTKSHDTPSAALWWPAFAAHPPALRCSRMGLIMYRAFRR